MDGINDERGWRRWESLGVDEVTRLHFWGWFWNDECPSLRITRGLNGVDRVGAICSLPPSPFSRPFIPSISFHFSYHSHLQIPKIQPSPTHINMGLYILHSLLSKPSPVQILKIKNLNRPHIWTKTLGQQKAQKESPTEVSFRHADLLQKINVQGATAPRLFTTLMNQPTKSKK